MSRYVAQNLARDFAESLVDGADDAIIATGLDGRVLTWNPAATRLFGYTAREAIGQPLELISPSGRHAEDRHLLECVRGGQAVPDLETIRRAKNGALIPVSITLSPIRSADAQVIGVSCIARDLSTREERAAELAATQADEARRANQLKDEFLATLSHELRTPLNAIVGYARMLESGVLPEGKQASALRILNRNAGALTQIVEDVLDISRIVSGKVRLDVQPVDLGTLLTEAVETMRLAADAKGIAMELTIDHNAGSIAGDPDRLRQVLWNLLSNAVKFTRRGGRIEARLTAGDTYVDISVTDTGIGLSSAFLPHIFERFRQADSRFSRAHGGLGLGLAISRHLIEMHGGTIAAESAGENQGTTFRVSIPIVQDIKTRTAGPKRAADAGLQTRTNLAGRLEGVRVLAVDDEEDALTLLRDILQTAGASVTTVQSPVAAQAVAEAIRPDVFITDIAMKEMDGFTLLSHFRQSAVPEVSRVPSVALTAYARSEDRLMAVRVGFQQHLAKPIDPDQLVATVRALSASSPTIG